MSRTNPIRAAAALALLAAAVAFAACGPRLHHGQGTVRAVDVAGGEVTLEHGAMPGFMDAMTMTYTVAEPSMLEGIEVGQQVDFAVAERGEELRITSIAPRR